MADTKIEEGVYRAWWEAAADGVVSCAFNADDGLHYDGARGAWGRLANVPELNVGMGLERFAQ